MNQREPAATFRLRTAHWVALAVALIAAAAWQCVSLGVNQDVRQTLGVLRAGRAGGFGTSDVWAHRPLVTRWLMTALGAPLPADPVAADHALRVACSLLAVAAAVLLGLGLRNRWGRAGASFTALAAGGALVLAPAWDFAEPEWLAACFAVAAVGVALLGGRRTGPVLASTLVALAAATKLTTLATAVVAVGLVWALDHLRGRWLAAASAVATAALLALTLLVAPHEWQWLGDMPALNPPATAALPAQLAEGWANHVLVSPFTLVALTALTDMAIRGRARAAAGGALAMAVLAAPFAVQHQGFLYHLAALPVLAAGLVATACVRGHLLRLLVGVPWTWLATAALGTAVGAGVFAVGPQARDGVWWLGLLLSVVAVALPLVETALAPRGAPHLLPVACAPLLCVALLVPLSPRTAYSVSLAHSAETAAANRQQARDARALRARVAAVVPPGEPVLHLGFATPWWLPNPSTCRYVSPTFLQRARFPGVAQTASYRENLSCLDDPRARVAVIERGWFDPARLPGPVADSVRRNFPCTAPVYADDAVLVCRRA